MKICFFGIYDHIYSRNAILLQGLRECGVEVIECHADWSDPKRYWKLLKALRALNNHYDYIYAAYPSPVPTILARLISKRPVITDAFYSMFESVVHDRKKYSRFHPISIKLLILDWLGCMFGHLIISDTEDQRRYWSSWWGIKSDKIRTVYLGINDQVFHPIAPTQKDFIQVHFQGTYIPLQGAAKIVQAATLVRVTDPRIRFRMIGSGRDFVKAHTIAEQEHLDIEFIGNVPLTDLNTYIAQADIVLGIFGDTEKALRVIPNKVYEGLAVQRPVITMDTPAIRELFSDGDMMLIHNNPQAIADAIITLARNKDLRTRLAQTGYARVLNYKPKDIAASLLTTISTYFS